MGQTSTLEIDYLLVHNPPISVGYTFCLAFANASAMAPTGLGARAAWLGTDGPRRRESGAGLFPGCAATDGRFAASSSRIASAIR